MRGVLRLFEKEFMPLKQTFVFADVLQGSSGLQGIPALPFQIVCLVKWE